MNNYSLLDFKRKREKGNQFIKIVSPISNNINSFNKYKIVGNISILVEIMKLLLFNRIVLECIVHFLYFKLP